MSDNDTSGLGWLAELRRKYHHLLNGGEVSSADLGRIIEDAERFVTSVENSTYRVKKEGFFMIRHVPSGEYSRGGSSPRFTIRGGKKWPRQSALVAHIALAYGNRFGSRLYDDCVVEEYETVSRRLGEEPVLEYVKKIEKKRAAKKAASEAIAAKEKEKREREILEQLKAKYEK